MTKTASSISEYLENPSLYNSIQSYRGINLINSKGETALMVAAKYGHSEIIKNLIERGAHIDRVLTVNLQDENFTQIIKTALIFAIENKQIDIVKLLIQNNASIIIREKSFIGIGLNHAVEVGSIPLVQLLLEYNADISKKDHLNNTPLRLAITNNNPEIVKLLLANKADLNTSNNANVNELVLATKHNNSAIIELILNEYKSRNQEIKNIQDILFEAVQNGDKDILQSLFENNAQLNTPKTKNLALSVAKSFASEAHNLITLAAQKGNSEIIELLLKNNANVDAATSNGKTALMIAAENKLYNTVKILLENNASPMKVTDNGYNILMAAAKGGDAEIVKLFLNNKKIVNSAEKNGKTSLLYAIESGNSEIVKLLLNNNVSLVTNKSSEDNSSSAQLAFVTVSNNPFSFNASASASFSQSAKISNNKALLYASRNGNSEIVKILLNRGVELETTDGQGMTSLMIAAENGHTPVVSLLLDNLADINKQDAGGHNALMFATRHGHIDIVKILLEYGAQINTINNNRKSPLEIALQENNQKIAQLLIESGADINLSLIDYIVKQKQLDLAVYLNNKLSLLDFIIKLSDDAEFNLHLKNHLVIPNTDDLQVDIASIDLAGNNDQEASALLVNL